MSDLRLEQIVVSPGQLMDTLYGIDENGAVWMRNALVDSMWRKLPMTKAEG